MFESINTLKFSDRAKNVFIKVQPNCITNYDENLITKLQSEIFDLKQILNFRKKRGVISNLEEEYLQLMQENKKLKEIVQNKIIYDSDRLDSIPTMPNLPSLSKLNSNKLVKERTDPNINT